MGAAGFDMPKPGDGRRDSDAGQALLFILPSIVVTVASILLFTGLTGFTVHQMNTFSIVIMAAIVFSLIGTAWIQVVLYRVRDVPEHFRDAPALRGIRVGMLYSLLYSAVTSVVLSICFTQGMQFSVLDCIYCSLLLVMYAMTWVFTAAFRAEGEYRQPAAVYTLSYTALFFLTLYAHRMDASYTLAGYTGGTIVLFVSSSIAVARAFRSPLDLPGIRYDVPRIIRLASQNRAGIAFNLFYIVALFLDKIIAWVQQGLAAGEGLLVTGPYTAGAFLGLVPMFAVAAVAHFTTRTRQLVEQRYSGTLEDIEKRARQYKHLYWTSLGRMVGIAIGLFLVTGAAAFFLVADAQIMKIMVTVALGSVFFLMIVHSAAVLPLFGRSNIAAIAVLAVCLGELAAIPWVGTDIWFAAVGFLAGSFAGCLINCLTVRRLFTDFEFHIFRFVLSSS